jgi:hypothetical protein
LVNRRQCDRLAYQFGKEDVSWHMIAKPFHLAAKLKHVFVNDTEML